MDDDGRGERDQLCKTLAKVFYEPDVARQLAVDAGMPRENLPMFHQPSVFWTKVVEYAHDGGLERGAEAIRSVAAKKMPHHPVFSPPRPPTPTWPVTTEIIRLSPRPRVELLHLIVGLLAMALASSIALNYLMSRHSAPWTTLLGGLSSPLPPDLEDPPNEPEAVAAPAPPDESVRWICLSFRSTGARSTSGRVTTCRKEPERCTKIEAFQSQRRRHPSRCVEVFGEHPADAFGTPRDRWPRSDVHKKGIDGWLYPYGDLIAK